MPAPDRRALARSLADACPLAWSRRSADAWGFTATGQVRAFVWQDGIGWHWQSHPGRRSYWGEATDREDGIRRVEEAWATTETTP